MLIPEILREKARELTDQVALSVDMGGDTDGENATRGILTFEQWDAFSDRVAALLVVNGVQPGDRVGIAFDNRDADNFCVAYFAALKANAVAVPIGVRLVESEVGHILRHAEPRAVIADDTRAASIGQLGFSSMSLIRPHDIRSALDDYSLQAPRLVRREDDLCDILYTSGTTGSPKGVASSHRNLMGLIGVNRLGKLRGHAFLHAIPLFTFAGCHGMQLNPLSAGMRAIVMHKFDPQRYLHLIAKHKVAASFAVPAMLKLAVDARAAMPESERPDAQTLRSLAFGAAPMPPATLMRLHEIAPNAFLTNTYGLTEAGGAVCAMPPKESAKRPNSVGKPVPPTEVKIVVEEENGSTRDAQANEVGEIWMRSSAGHRTYFRDPEATARTFVNGWLKTGDLGHLDEDGYLYLDDRKKDLVIRGGFNIYPNEIDALLEAHPSIREAAVIGIAHPVLGEDLKAFVALKPGTSETAESLRDYLAKHLSDYKIPRNFAFVDSLPRSAIGKVIKRQLREAQP